MAGYNVMRSVEELLAQHESSPASFAIHLYPEYWSMNNINKFLYTQPVASLLDDIRAQRIPADFLELFDAANLPFYDGCMIVELLDYRPVKSKDPVLVEPERSRVVLTPNPETLWTDICLMNQKTKGNWTDQDALEVEARILLSTAPPLCLDPDPHLARIANSVLRVSMPKTPPSLKRKAAAIEQEEEDNDKARRVKISQYMNPRNNRSTPPTYRILELLQKVREGKVTSSPKPESKPIASAAGVTNANGNSGINPSTGINPSALQGSHSNLPPILPASSNGVPAPPTAANVTNGPPPSVVRQSPRPPSTIPAPPTATATAIPHHMQHLYPLARNTPPPPAQMQRPPSAAGPQGSPVPRPPSIAHTPPQVPPPAGQPQGSSQTQPPPVARPQPGVMTQQQLQLQQQRAFLQHLMSRPEQLVQFVEHNPAFKNFAPPIQQVMRNRVLQLKSQSAAQQQHAVQQARAAAATPAHNGTQTPVPTIAVTQPVQQQAPHPPQQPHYSPQPPQQRNSPLPTNQPLVSRSPMPANAQTTPQMAHQTTPQMAPQMTPQMLQQMAHGQAQGTYPAYTVAQVQNQFNSPQLRVMHPQMMANLANGTPQAAAAAAMMAQQAQQAPPNQDQAQAHAGQPMMTPQMGPSFAMYNYAQMNANMQHGRVPQYAWTMGMQRGMTPANMLQQQQQQQQQQQMQMQMNAGKTGMPGT